MYTHINYKASTCALEQISSGPRGFKQELVIQHDLDKYSKRYLKSSESGMRGLTFNRLTLLSLTGIEHIPEVHNGVTNSVKLPQFS